VRREGQAGARKDDRGSPEDQRQHCGDQAAEEPDQEHQEDREGDQLRQQQVLFEDVDGLRRSEVRTAQLHTRPVTEAMRQPTRRFDVGPFGACAEPHGQVGERMIA
jgi:hypothetical protein